MFRSEKIYAKRREFFYRTIFLSFFILCHMPANVYARRKKVKKNLDRNAVKVKILFAVLLSVCTEPFLNKTEPIVVNSN